MAARDLTKHELAAEDYRVTKALLEGWRAKADEPATLQKIAEQEEIIAAARARIDQLETEHAQAPAEVARLEKKLKVATQTFKLSRKSNAKTADSLVALLAKAAALQELIAAAKAAEAAE